LDNLKAEDVGRGKMFLAGNSMIDSLEASRRSWERSSIQSQLEVSKGQPGVLALRRLFNGDYADTFAELIGAVAEIAQERPVIFPVHPLTCSWWEDMDKLRPFLQMDGRRQEYFNGLLGNSGRDDSAGISCLTLR
jgi:UDP-N-acetylglucosamine 2-epimerase (non-hydrolysing)